MAALCSNGTVRAPLDALLQQYKPPHPANMARLSVENSDEHIAALKTPDQKGARKSSRFKDFFKGSHTRTSSGSDYHPSPLAMSALGVDENLKPGFEKVRLHPSERSPVSETIEQPTSGSPRVSDAEESNKDSEDLRLEEQIRQLQVPEEKKQSVKEFYQRAKMELQKEQETLKQFEQDDGHQVEESAPTDGSNRHSVKAMKVLGIESGLQEEDAETTGIATDAKEPSTIKLDDPSSQTGEQVTGKDLTNAQEEGNLLEDSTFNVSYYGSDDSDSDRSLAVQDLISASRPPIRFSPQSKSRLLRKILTKVGLTDGTVEDLRASARAQEIRSGQIASIVEESNEESVRAYASEINQRKVLQAMDARRRTHVDNIEEDAVTVHTTARKEDTPVPANTSITNAFKIGPWEIEPERARLLIDYLPFAYGIFLFVIAIPGPLNFCTELWKVLLLAVSYIAQRKIFRNDEDGSSDVLLVPVENVAQMAKQYGTEIMEILIKMVVKSYVEALMDASEELNDELVA